MFEVNKTYSTKFSNQPTTERIYIFTSKFNKINKSVVHPTFYDYKMRCIQMPQR